MFVCAQPAATTTFNGTLDITIHDAQLITAQTGRDLFCIATLGSSGLKNLLEGQTWGKEKFHTKIHIGAGQHPVWAENHSLSLKNMKFQSHLKVKLYNKDIPKDHLLGVAKLNLDELLQYDNKGVQYVPLYKELLPIGAVGIAVKFNCTEIPQLGHSDTKTPVQDPRKDVQDPRKDVQDPTKDVQDPTKDVQDPTKDVQDPRKDVQDPRKDQEPMMQGSAQQTHLEGSQESEPSTYQGSTQTPPTGQAPQSSAPHVTGTSNINPKTTLNGTLNITIADAKIPIRQRFGKQDPYCIVTFGKGGSGLKKLLNKNLTAKDTIETKVHTNGGQHPIWNETHTHNLKNAKLDSHFEVRVYDKDLLIDDYIGIVTRTLGDLLAYDKKGVHYFTLHKQASAIKQATIKDEDGNILEDGNGQIGEIGLGFDFSISEFPGRATDNQHIGTTLQGPDQATDNQQTGPTHPGPKTTTVNQSLDTKPVYSQGLAHPQTQDRTY